MRTSVAHPSLCVAPAPPRASTNKPRAWCCLGGGGNSYVCSCTPTHSQVQAAQREAHDARARAEEHRHSLAEKVKHAKRQWAKEKATLRQSDNSRAKQALHYRYITVTLPLHYNSRAKQARRRCIRTLHALRPPRIADHPHHPPRSPPPVAHTHGAPTAWTRSWTLHYRYITVTTLLHRRMENA